MKLRIEAACAGFLITIGLNHLASIIALLGMDDPSDYPLAWLGSIVGVFIAFGTGIHLLRRGWAARVIAMIGCGLFLLIELYGLHMQSGYVPLEWTDFVSQGSLGSIACLTLLLLLKKEPIQPPQTTTGSSAPDRV